MYFFLNQPQNLLLFSKKNYICGKFQIINYDQQIHSHYIISFIFIH